MMLMMTTTNIGDKNLWVPPAASIDRCADFLESPISPWNRKVRKNYNRFCTNNQNKSSTNKPFADSGKETKMKWEYFSLQKTIQWKRKGNDTKLTRNILVNTAEESWLQSRCCCWRWWRRWGGWRGIEFLTCQLHWHPLSPQTTHRYVQWMFLFFE